MKKSDSILKAVLGIGLALSLMGNGMIENEKGLIKEEKSWAAFKKNVEKEPIDKILIEVKNALLEKSPVGTKLDEATELIDLSVDLKEKYLVYKLDISTKLLEQVLEETAGVKLTAEQRPIFYENIKNGFKKGQENSHCTTPFANIIMNKGISYKFMYILDGDTPFYEHVVSKESCKKNK